MFCKHKWKMLSETTTQSKLEHSMEMFQNGKAVNSLPWQLCDAERKHIQTFVCDKCGSLKRFIETI